MANILEKIIGCKNDGMYRIVTIFGLRFKFNNARKQVVARLDDIESQLSSLEEKILMNKNDEILKVMFGKNRDLWETNYSSFRYYQNDFEKKFVQPFFEYMDRFDFQDKYLALCKNLSDENVRKINKILYRLNILKVKTNLVRYNFFSQEEQLEKIKILTDLRQQIIPIGKNFYAYGLYKLPVRLFLFKKESSTSSTIVYKPKLSPLILI